MAATPNLDLPYLAAGQAQKHVTLNDSLRALDALVQIGVASRVVTAPPPAPVEGETYIVPTSPSGAWAGQSGKLTAFQDGAWAFFVPREGWLAWAGDENRLLVFDGSAWILAALPAGSLDQLGVNATPDSGNRLVVSSPATLFNHEGAGHQVKINKASAAQSGTLMFQSAFSGRAEIGLAGDDDLHVKVSANGSAWTEALVINRTNARMGLGTASPTARLHVAGEVRIGTFTVAGLPNAATTGAGAIAYVSNEAGGAVLAFSDGAAWRRVTDRAVVS